MDKLIDLNKGEEKDRAYDYQSEYGAGYDDDPGRDHEPESYTDSWDDKPSVLDRPDPKPNEITRAGFGGLFWGFLISLAPGFVTFIVFVITTEFESDDSLRNFISVLALILASGMSIGYIIGVANLNREAREGFVRIDMNNLEFWLRGKTYKIPLQYVFGAAPEKTTFRWATRVCYLSKADRGFSMLVPCFKDYIAIEGPALKLGSSNELHPREWPDDGNLLFRQTVRKHLARRISRDLPVSKCPEFKFNAVQKEIKLFGKGSDEPASYFRCDGETIEYKTKDQLYKIPVKYIKRVKMTKVQSRYGLTAYYVNVYLDQMSGYEKVKVDILKLKKREEVDRYLHTLPTLFHDLEKDSYWG